MAPRPLPPPGRRLTGTTFVRLTRQNFRPRRLFVAGGPQAFQQALAATLSFLGVGPQTTTATKLSGTLSFTGPVTRNAVFKILTAAILGFSGALAAGKQFHQTQTAGLSFTGPTNLKNAIKKVMTATLGFTGPANLRLALIKFMTATLGFTGPVNLRNTIATRLTGGLSFTGAQSRLIGYHLFAGLSFIGSNLRRTVKTLTAATLGFTGNLAAGKQFHQNVLGGLSFSGATTTGLIYGRALAATLSLVGSQPVRVAKKLVTSVLGFNNYFVNPGFEMGFAGWTKGDAAWAIDSSTSRTGSSSAKIAVGYYDYIFQSVFLPRGTYVFSGWAKTSSDYTASNPQGVEVEVGSAILSFGAHGPALVAGQDWTRTFRAFTVTTPGSPNFITSNTYGGVTTGTVWWDDMELLGAPTLSRQTSHVMAGSLGFVGSLPRRSGRILTGVLGFLGNLIGVKIQPPVPVPINLAVTPTQVEMDGPKSDVKISGYDRDL